MTRSRKLGTTLKSRLHQKFLSHEVVTRSRMKTENLVLLESVTRQFSSLPIFVDCNKVRKYSNTFYIHGWKLSSCVNVNQLLIEHAISHLCQRVEVSNIISRSTLNEKLVFSRFIKIASLTIFCVPLPSYNFMVSMKDDFYCGYFALRDER